MSNDWFSALQLFLLLIKSSVWGLPPIELASILAGSARRVVKKKTKHNGESAAVQRYDIYKQMTWMDQPLENMVLGWD